MVTLFVEFGCSQNFQILAKNHGLLSTVWWNVLMAFLHNRAVESHEIVSECSHQ